MNKNELQQQILQIEENLAQMESQLEDFPNLTDSEKSELIKRMEDLKQVFEKKIRDLEKNLIQLGDSAIEPSAIEDLEEKLEEIVKVLKQRASEHYDVDYNKGIEVNNDENQEMLAEGQDLFNEGMELANNMLKNLKEANTMMVDIEAEIYEQRMKLIRTKDTLKEAQNLTNRTKELVGYFSNQMAKDKCFKIMIGVMAVLLVGCIIMLYFYKDQIGIEQQIEKQELINDHKEFQFDDKGQIALAKDQIEAQDQNLFSNLPQTQQERAQQQLGRKVITQKLKQKLDKMEQQEHKKKRSRKLLSFRVHKKRKAKKYENFNKDDLKAFDYLQEFFTDDSSKESMI